MRLLAEVCYWDQWGEAPLDAPKAEALPAREAADLGDESPCFSGAYATC
jgi:hypothetical protein